MRNQQVFRVMLVSSVLVILLRLGSSIEIGWDLSIQLEAAYRLVQGLGLTNAFSSQLDLNQPPYSEYLTHFPPGLSLLLAAFLFFNIPLVFILKLIYTLITMIGWINWSIISSHCLKYPIKLNSISLPINVFIAAILPIIGTPKWPMQGTDIFLWAGIPIFLLLLLGSFRSRHWIILTIFGGIMCGLLIFFRYSSAFLLLVGYLLIVSFSFPQIKKIIIRFTVLTSSSLFFIIPIWFYLKKVSKSGWNVESSNDLLQTHGARFIESNLIESTSTSIKTILLSFSGLVHLSYISLDRLLIWLIKYPTINVGLGLFFLVSIFYLYIKLIKYRKYLLHNQLFKVDILLSLLCLLIGWVIFSILLTFQISYSPLIVKRFYIPIQPCFILIPFTILRLPNFNRPLKKISIILVSFFILSLPIWIFYHLINGETKDIVHKVGISTKINYPSHQISNIYPESLNFLKKAEEKERQDLDILFFAQNYPLYASYINFNDTLRFRRISDSSFWEGAYVSKPTKIFWIINNPDCPLICASGGNFNLDGSDYSIEALDSLPNLTTVFLSSQEQTKIMTSNLPVGYRFGSTSKK